MTNDMRDWLSFVMAAVSLLLPFVPLVARRRHRRIERRRTFKLWGLEWTAHDREDDHRA